MNAFSRMLVSCAFAIAFPVACLAATPSVSDLVATYSNLTVGPARQVSSATFTIGHLTLKLAGGSAAPVMAGDRQVGHFYVGDGTFSYTSTEKVEFPAIKYNARSSKVKIEAAADKVVVRDTLTRVLLLGSALPVIAQEGSAPALEPAFQQHREAFSHHWAPPAAHRLAIDALDDSSPTFMRSEIAAEQLYIHELDEHWRNAEALTVLRRLDTIDPILKHALFAILLSEQPIGRDIRDARAPRVMLSHVDIALVASDGKDASLTVTETLVPQKRPASVFRFDLYDREYVESGREPRNYIVKSITDAAGRKLSFSHAGDELLVSLPEAAAPGQKVTMRFDIEGDFLYRPGGDNYWELGISDWFPQVERNEQSFTFHSVVKVKKPFIPFAPGKTIRREEEGDYNVVETQIDQPVQWIAILAGKYHFDEETRDGRTIRVASYATKNATALKQLREVAFSVIAYFEHFLGPFPFTELNIIEKNDYGYGQAPAGTMFITKEAFAPMQRESKGYVRDINERFAHEIAHQWWGTVVKMPSAEEQWLTEAFAEYCAALYIKAHKGEHAYNNMLATWRADAKDATEKAPIPLANRLQNFGDRYGRFLVRKGLIYDKGAYLLAVLHKELGDQMFLTFLKSYQRSFRWKYGSTQDVAGLLKFLTKTDYSDFLEQYYWGTAMPEIKR